MGKGDKWALILGGSSGLGLATARKLAAHGFNLVVVHRDRRTDMEAISKVFQDISANGTALHSFNKDAVTTESMNHLISEVKDRLEGGSISVLVHSIAKGTVKPMNDPDGDTLSAADFEITVDAMAISLYSWVKVLVENNLTAADTRVISYTSEGNTKAWKNYAAVSAAKAALEVITRNIALEFAADGIKANCIQAGVTDTKSLQMIPNSGLLKQQALKRNPNHRLTTPEDVANVAYLLTTQEAQWITGTVIKVDGGESLR
nr:SDR family oxidoreductase [Allomuricauda sp.]